MSRIGHGQVGAMPMLCIFAIVSMSVVACASRAKAPHAVPHRISDIKTVLVLPFDSATERHGVGSTVQCSICGGVFVTGTVTSDNETYMTERLLTFLKTKTTYTLVPPGSGEGVRSKLLSESVGLSDRELIVEMGRSLKVDAVVTGTIYRFGQRVGTRFSVDTPASVAFGIHLIRVADGRLLWTGHSDETQQPLSENLFKISRFIKGGGGWLTAEELATLELNRVMTDFPLP